MKATKIHTLFDLTNLKSLEGRLKISDRKSTVNLNKSFTFFSNFNLNVIEIKRRTGFKTCQETQGLNIETKNSLALL